MEMLKTVEPKSHDIYSLKESITYLREPRSGRMCTQSIMMRGIGQIRTDLIREDGLTLTVNSLGNLPDQAAVLCLSQVTLL